MFPSPQKHTVMKPSTLREFIEGLGAEVEYAYEQRVVVVTVNCEHLWPSAHLEAGDVVAIFPIITGG